MTKSLDLKYIHIKAFVFYYYTLPTQQQPSS